MIFFLGLKNDDDALRLIILHPTCFWKMLIFLDLYNMGGSVFHDKEVKNDNFENSEKIDEKNNISRSDELDNIKEKENTVPPKKKSQDDELFVFEEENEEGNCQIEIENYDCNKKNISEDPDMNNSDFICNNDENNNNRMNVDKFENSLNTPNQNKKFRLEKIIVEGDYPLENEEKKTKKNNDNFSNSNHSAPSSALPLDDNWQLSLQWDFSKYFPIIFFRPFFILIGKFILYASKGLFIFFYCLI
jgi:hypothetical protein